MEMGAWKNQVATYSLQKVYSKHISFTLQAVLLVLSGGSRAEGEEKEILLLTITTLFSYASNQLHIWFSTYLFLLPTSQSTQQNLLSGNNYTCLHTD